MNAPKLHRTFFTVYKIRNYLSIFNETVRDKTN